MKRCVYLFLLSILLVAGLTACGSGKAEQEVPSLNALPVSWVSLPAVS